MASHGHNELNRFMEIDKLLSDNFKQLPNNALNVFSGILLNTITCNSQQTTEIVRIGILISFLINLSMQSTFCELQPNGRVDIRNSLHYVFFFKIHTEEKIHISVILLSAIKSLQIFAHDMTA